MFTFYVLCNIIMRYTIYMKIRKESTLYKFKTVGIKAYI